VAMNTQTVKLVTVELGQRVRIKDADLRGLVTGILLDSDGVQYRVVYWVDGVRRAEWLYPSEIEP
jgi:hypothetical protein